MKYASTEKALLHLILCKKQRLICVHPCQPDVFTLRRAPEPPRIPSVASPPPAISTCSPATRSLSTSGLVKALAPGNETDKGSRSSSVLGARSGKSLQCEAQAGHVPSTHEITFPIVSKPLQHAAAHPQPHKPCTAKHLQIQNAIQASGGPLIHGYLHFGHHREAVERVPPAPLHALVRFSPGLGHNSR